MESHELVRTETKKNSYLGRDWLEWVTHSVPPNSLESESESPTLEDVEDLEKGTRDNRDREEEVRESTLQLAS